MKKNILNIFLNFFGGIFFWLFFGLFFPFLLYKRAGYYFFDKNIPQKNLDLVSKNGNNLNKTISKKLYRYIHIQQKYQKRYPDYFK